MNIILGYLELIGVSIWFYKVYCKAGIAYELSLQTFFHYSLLFQRHIVIDLDVEKPQIHS